MMLEIRHARPSDAEVIRSVLVSNANDPSLFQQPLWRIRRDINDFLVAVSDRAVIGCAAVHRHDARNTEILAFAVRPEHHRQGVGRALMQHCLALAGRDGTVWLSTRKPGYFDRFGFAPMSMWSLPLSVLVYKLRLVFEQPVSRWISAVQRSCFMVYS